MDISSAREVGHSPSPGDTEASDEEKRQVDAGSLYKGNGSKVGACDDIAGDISDGTKQRDDISAGDDGSQAGRTTESLTRTSGKDDVTFLQNTRSETTKPVATSTAAEPERNVTEGKLELVRQFDEKPAVFSLHDAGVRLNVSESCLGHGEVAGPITVLIDKMHLIECDDQAFLSSVVVDCQPSGKRFPTPLALDFRVGEPLDEDSEDDDSDNASGEGMRRNLDGDQLKRYMGNLQDEYKVFVREEEGDAWSVLEDEKTKVLYEEGMFFVRASIEHFSQGRLAKMVDLACPGHEERVTWPSRPGKKQIEFVNATDRTLTYFVLPTSWSNSVIQEIAGGIAVQGVTMEVAIKRAVDQSILLEATGPQYFQVPPSSQREPIRAGQMCPFQTCTLAKKTGCEARVVLITFDDATVSVWYSRIVAHRTRVVTLPAQFSDNMTPLLKIPRYALAPGNPSTMSEGLQPPVNHTRASLGLWTTLQNEMSHLVGILWTALQSLQDACKMVDGKLLACAVLVFLVAISFYGVDNPQA